MTCGVWRVACVCVCVCVYVTCHNEYNIAVLTLIAEHTLVTSPVLSGGAFSDTANAHFAKATAPEYT